MRRLNQDEVEDLCRAQDLDKGQAYFKQGKVDHAWHSADSLQALVAGSGKRPYQVNIADRDGKLSPKCTCPAHRRWPFCKHVAAVLLAWVHTPDRFAAGVPPVAEEPAKKRSTPASTPRRRRSRPKVDRKQVQLEGLAKVEELLVGLTNYGLLSLTDGLVSRVGDLAHTAESHKLRRLGRRLIVLGSALERALRDRENFDELVYAGLVADAWLAVRATRRAFQDPEVDPTDLQELIGKTWREKDLEKREDVTLAELAYGTVILEEGFTVDTSYLLSLEDGQLYTEMQIVPTHLKRQERKPSHTGRLTGTIGLYPGHEPRRVKLIEVAPPAPLAAADWEKALRHAESSASALVRDFQEATASPLAPRISYALFAPHQIWIDGSRILLLDQEGQAIPLHQGWRAQNLFTRHQVAAFFGRLVPQSGTLALTPMALITEPPHPTLLRLVGHPVALAT
jgi:hypothetical protein